MYRVFAAREPNSHSGSVQAAEQCDHDVLWNLWSSPVAIVLLTDCLGLEKEEHILFFFAVFEFTDNLLITVDMDELFLALNELPNLVVINS